ncbi:uncharacterized protein LOC143290171 [Babylonia areolata]|uniref:uncharacterized protein LOC143290171 n=1 Tax=Babylonia areolata TaxID=304850 RepID=UPI003FD31FEA
MASAAAVAIEASSFLCPVCREDFSHPKILPCTHLVCRHCLLTLLDTGDHLLATCPLCRASIVPLDAQGHGDLDLDRFVDDLATDLVTMVKVEARNVLRGKDVCLCDRNVPATVFCLHCYEKLCAACAKVHQRLPATRHHRTEALCSLTTEQLLTMRPPPPCPTHPHLPTDRFCLTHQHLVCVECLSLSRGGCQNVASVPEAASRERAKLKGQGERLTKKMRRLDEQIKLQNRQKKTASTSVSSQNDLEKQRNMIAAYSDLIQRLLSADDAPLLMMSCKLQTWLDKMEAWEAPDAPEIAEADDDDFEVVDRNVVVGNEDVVEEVVGWIAAFGRLTLKLLECPSAVEAATPAAAYEDHQQDSGGNLSRTRPCLARENSSPCRQCADDIVALDKGDMHTCHQCTRVRFACETCGYVVTLRHSDGFKPEVSACPGCGGC